MALIPPDLFEEMYPPERQGVARQEMDEFKKATLGLDLPFTERVQRMLDLIERGVDPRNVIEPHMVYDDDQKEDLKTSINHLQRRMSEIDGAIRDVMGKLASIERTYRGYPEEAIRDNRKLADYIADIMRSLEYAANPPNVASFQVKGLDGFDNSFFDGDKWHKSQQDAMTSRKKYQADIKDCVEAYSYALQNDLLKQTGDDDAKKGQNKDSRKPT